MKKLTLGWPCYRGQIQDAHVASFELLRQGTSRSEVFELYGFVRADTCSVSHGRNILVYNAMKDGANWLLMMDSDTYFASLDNPHPTVTMLEEALKQDAAVVAAGVALRDGTRRINIVREEEYLPKPDGRLAECKLAGSAYMAINLDWLKACWPKGPWFEEELSYEDGPIRKGEDIVFCERIKARGGRILADTRFVPHHVGA